MPPPAPLPCAALPRSACLLGPVRPLRPARRRVGSWAGLAAAALAAVLTGCATAPPPTDAAALIGKAEAALGSTRMSTLTFRGRGRSAVPGQTYAPGEPAPVATMRGFSRSSHFDERAYREEFVRNQVEVAEESDTTFALRGVVLARQAFSWDVVDIGLAPAQTSWVARMHDLWLSSPQGAVKAAARHGARAARQRSGWRTMDTLSFTVPGQFSATLWLQDDGRVAHVDSVLPDPLHGDIAVRTEFSSYRLFGSVPFPQRIVQRHDGVTVLDVQVGSVVLDGSVEITVPENVRTTGNAPTVEWLADGVWVLAGASHHSVLVEQSGQLVLVEAPLDDQRARALVGAARRLAGPKPLGAVVATHHHPGHVGGLRVVAAEGATIYSSTTVRPWLQAAFRRPLTARADPLGETATTPDVQAVRERLVLDDPLRPLEIHVLRDSPHAAGLLMVWLPKQQILIQTDAWTPGAPDEAPSGPPEPGLVNLADNLQRLGIRPQRVVPLHGRVVTAAELWRALGRSAPP